MYIKEAQLNNFGKFYQRNISFSPGLNVVYGENESGKSTLHSFLVGMLFGLEKSRGRAAKADAYQHYEPWNVATYYSGDVEFEITGNEHITCEGKNFILERNFYHKDKTARLYNQADGEELSVEHGDLTMLMGGINRQIYENTCCIPQATVQTEPEFAERLQQELINSIYGGDIGIDLRYAIKQLEKKRRQTDQQLRSLQQQRQQLLERMEWEQGLLKEDISMLEQRLSAPRQIREQKEQRRKKLLGIPIIGWLLRFLWRILGMDKNRKQEVEEQLEEQLSEKQTRLMNSAEEQAEYSVSWEEERLRMETESIQLAIDSLTRVAQDAYREYKEEIQNEISRIFSEITLGAYKRVEVTEEGKISIYGPGRCLEPWQLSKGTMEQLYFAIRMGMSKFLMQEEVLPVLLDETFCAYDDLRLKQTLGWLAKQKGQVILFTSQKRELMLLEELGVKYQKVML